MIGRARTALLRAFALAPVALAAATALAGPPFLTDDPDPVPYRHYEAYLFGTVDRAADGTFWFLPAGEFNVGAAPGLQLHLVVPAAYLSTTRAYGFGDVEVGVKYRLLRETGSRPEVGVFPMAELPAGDAARGLGNGRLWARLPLWIQKSRGPWTTYGGVGYQINHAPGAKNSFFAGWLLQRQVSGPLTLGAEIFHQESQAQGARQTTFVDVGGYENIAGGLSLLFMAGHTVAGETHTIGYLGLYYTWGPKSPASN